MAIKRHIKYLNFAKKTNIICDKLQKNNYITFLSIARLLTVFPRVASYLYYKPKI